MVARILSGKSIRAPLTYNERKVAQGKAQLIMGSRFGGEVERLTFQQKLRRFEHLTQLNARVKTNALHITLNFDPSERIGTLKLQAIAAAYMERIGFGEQPFLVYRHEDAAHPHLHIVTTNIRSDGSRIDLHNIGKTLSEEARKALEEEFSLVRAEGKKQSREAEVPLDELRRVTYGKKPTRQVIHEVVTTVLNRYAITSLAELKAVLGIYGVAVERVRGEKGKHRREGLVYSLLDPLGNRVGMPLKAGSLPSRPTLSSLEKSFARGEEKRMALKSSLTTAVDSCLANGNISKGEFIQQLDMQGITAVFHESAQGFTFGVTFIDHRRGAVFKGSSLGKAYSAQALTSRLQDTTEDKTPSPERAADFPWTHPAPNHENRQGQPRHREGALTLEHLLMPLAQPDSTPSAGKKGKKRKRRFRL